MQCGLKPVYFEREIKSRIAYQAVIVNSQAKLYCFEGTNTYFK